MARGEQSSGAQRTSRREEKRKKISNIQKAFFVVAGDQHEDAPFFRRVLFLAPKMNLFRFAIELPNRLLDSSIDVARAVAISQSLQESCASHLPGEI